MKPGKLFHAVVIVGASLTGCAGEDDAAFPEDASHDATADDGMVLIL